MVLNRKAPPSGSVNKSRPDDAAGGSRGLLVLSTGFAVAAVAAGYFAVLDPDPAATAAGLRPDLAAASHTGAPDRPGTSTDETGMADELDGVPAVVMDRAGDVAPGSGMAVAADDEPPAPTNDVREHVLAPGEKVQNALEAEGLTRAAAAEIVAAMTPSFDFRLARDGDRFTVEVAPDGKIAAFEYARSPEDVLVATRDAGGRLEVHRKSVDTTTEVAQLGASISHSLYATIERIGESPSLVVPFAEVFAWDIDFYVDTQPDDRVRIVVEKIFHEGKFLRYGRILAAEYAGKVGTFHAYWYTDSKGHGDYYDDEGRSLQKAFLKTPLKFVKITSKFTPKRMHPVLHTITSHLGVDYAAPTGTPVRAVADGVVTFAGWKGPNGNLVVVKHKNDYVSAYAHLSRIPPDVKAGARVGPKRVIGYVGSTGYSTGPHLHFALRKDGKFVNPLAMKMLPGDPIAGDEKKGFLDYAASKRVEMDHIALLHPRDADPVPAPSAVP
ncbi:MAG TPA: M23 family metallopeptidase [Myxococcota bacterium]|jgi:murein DD-endopeptidase MepM/ murein hydrolase activator NlpD|nr:M23 family metallopeptidase [Myxococcota bacterium]